MTLIRKLLNRRLRVNPAPRFGDGTDLDLPYSTMREDRPYVIAMREVAADTLYGV
jgi:hypothetical protein